MKKTLITSLLALGLASAASAQTIVDWDAYSSGTTTIRSQSGIADTLFSDSTVLGSNTTTGDIYGGYFTDTSVATINKWEIGNTDYASSALRMNLNNTTGADFAGLALTAGSPTLNAGDTFTLQASAGTLVGAYPVRWLISNNSKYYVSDDVGTTIAKDGDGTPLSTTLTGLSWYEVDFSSPASGTITVPGTATTDNVFDTVDGVGFLAADVDNSGMRFASFEVVAIPEPSTFALFAGALGLGLVLLRRRR